MHSTGRPWWQQATALVSLGAGGAVTGFSFVPRPAADLKAPSGMPIRLLALEHSARQASADDTVVRSAIVNVANHYLRVAAGKTPAEVQALIWQRASVDGADHGASCAAFASLTLELGAHVVDRQSWVTGGSSYPWPLHQWADVRVLPNPASPAVTSILQDAQAHDRWRPVGDGYQPLPGDWVLFDGHVEVVTKYAGGVLHTIGGDSLPNFSVNAHEYPDPLAGQGVIGFVDNGGLPAASGGAPGGGSRAADGPGAGDPAGAELTAIPGTPGAGWSRGQRHHGPGDAAIPAAAAPAAGPGGGRPQGQESQAGPERHSQAGPDRQPQAGPDRPAQAGRPAGQGRSAAAVGGGIPGAGLSGLAANPPEGGPGAAVIPGMPITARHLPAHAHAPSTAPAGGHSAQPATGPAHDTDAQQSFIGEVAPGAVAAQRRYGVPASVTIAQAILESGWGQGNLAAKDHNLFGIKGAGPAGSDAQPTREYENGQLVTRTKAFRVYRSAAESIDDHGRLLASSEYYRKPMADRHDPNAFAAALTGVYATDPDYGAKLVSLMRRYDLYRYDTAAAAPAAHAARAGGATIPGVPADGSSAGPVAAAGAAAGAAGAPAARTRPEVSGQAGGSLPQPAVARSGSGTAQSEPTAGPAGPAPAGPTGRGGPGSATPQPTADQVGPGPATPQPTADQVGPGPAQPGPGAEPGPTAQPMPEPAFPQPAAQPAPDPARPRAAPSTQAASARPLPAKGKARAHKTAARPAGKRASRYVQPLPPSVTKAFTADASGPLMSAEPLYRDVASHSGIRWQLLAACDWMQCRARPRYSPVHGERLGTVNPGGMAYRTKSAALEQCADELVELAQTVYGIDLTAPAALSVCDLANAFAAFRWGGLLKLHRTSALEFPYSVAGLTVQHIRMRWPNIDDANTPDKPGGRFHGSFGAVPVVLSLNYPATV